MTALRVLLVDDHLVVRAGLRMLVESQPDLALVGEAGDGEAAVAEAARLLPDVVVMDLSLPGIGGLEATARIRRDCPGVQVVVLSAHDGDAYLGAARAAGAAGYVSKWAAADELARAIRRAAETRPAPVAPEGPARGPDRPSAAGAGAAPDDPEEGVLRLLAAGASAREIAARLGVDVEAVGPLRAAAMERFGLETRADVVRHALRRGWLSDD